MALPYKRRGDSSLGYWTHLVILTILGPLWWLVALLIGVS